MGMSAQTNINSNKENTKSIGRFLKETKGELKKVHWPNKKELTKYTGVVLTTCLLMTGLVWAVDSGIGFLLKLMLNR
ncbi:MAG: preprotein translocase subunit SecE [Tepidibacter sp.]|jgi:preprotein translocase subunit SecE|uniref:preprotein translocase subunit SecE n=1 Tax=Tepidibacter sp. TaxID=2529387 RepID=UPI0025ED3BED|nr:preprotein translocase subunit SecE [Tepidibacter sp.]MCT4509707.1 preprotein translocase subunit SecE [Tepidibacter sp.]